MRKAAIVLGLVLLLFAFPFPAGIGQMEPEEKPEEPMKEFPLRKIRLPAVDIQKEIELLTMINLLELSNDQMVQLRDILSELLDARAMIQTAQEELRDFLLEFQGTREEFQEAMVLEEEKLQATREAFEGKVDDTLDQIKNILTIKQGEVLLGFLIQPEQALPAEEEAVAEIVTEKLGFEFSDCSPKEAEEQRLEKAPAEEVLRKAQAVAPMIIAQLKVRKFLLTNLELIVNLLQEKLERLGVEQPEPEEQEGG